MNLLDFKPSKKICILGNVASGKTRLARKIAQQNLIEVTHVDSIQFDKHLQIQPLEKTRQFLKDIENLNQWIIDGYGPLEMLEQRFQKADLIIFLDPPLWKNYFWLTYRQIKNIFSGRNELPIGANELKWIHIKKLYRTTWTIHFIMRKELLKLLDHTNNKAKVVRL